MNGKELNKEELKKIYGGFSQILFICEECGNEIPQTAEDEPVTNNYKGRQSGGYTPLPRKMCPYCQTYQSYRVEGTEY